MKKILVFVFVLIPVLLQAQQVDWTGAQWIWQTEDGPSNSWVSFRKTLQLENLPESALAKISADSKFWLWINGNLVVFEGGAARGPSQAGDWDRVNKITPANSWYESVELRPFLKEGENIIAILVWYWGRETHKGTHVDSKKGGFLFHCDLGNKTIHSDSTWKMKLHPGYDNTIEPANASLVQYPVKFDANTNMNDWSENAWYTANFSDDDWENAVEKGMAGSSPWYDLIET